MFVIYTHLHYLHPALDTLLNLLWGVKHGIWSHFRYLSEVLLHWLPPPSFRLNTWHTTQSRLPGTGPVYRIRQCEFAVPLHVYFHVLYYKSLSATNQEDKGPCLPVCVLPGCGGEGMLKKKSGNSKHTHARREHANQSHVTGKVVTLSQPSSRLDIYFTQGEDDNQNRRKPKSVEARGKSKRATATSLRVLSWIYPTTRLSEEEACSEDSHTTPSLKNQWKVDIPKTKSNTVQWDSVKQTSH